MRDRHPIDGRPDSKTSGTGASVEDHETEHVDRGSPVADGGVQTSTVLEALADGRRRNVLYYLQDVERAGLREVAEYVAARETEGPPEELDHGTKRTVQIDLYHVQFPKLECAGLLEYDRRDGSVRYRPSDPVERVLDYCASIESSDGGPDSSACR